MQPGGANSQKWLACGVAGQAMPGETLSGDLHVVRLFTGGVLLAALDGLGHGREAAAASKTAAAVLESHAEEPLSALVRRCHEALARTRGAVMTLATLHSDGRLTWLGVGNIEAAVLPRAGGNSGVSFALLLRNGVVGHQLPPLYTSTMPVAAGDLLILATDGIGGGFAECVVRSDPPQKIANRILERHFKGTDDALVLVARYIGTSHESPSR